MSKIRLGIVGCGGIVSRSHSVGLGRDEDIIEIKCNVKLVGCDLGDSFTSDFVCIKKSGETMVRECVEKSKLLKPLTCKILDSSRNYWLAKGVEDWGIVVGEE